MKGKPCPQCKLHKKAVLDTMTIAIALVESRDERIAALMRTNCELLAKLARLQSQDEAEEESLRCWARPQGRPSQINAQDARDTWERLAPRPSRRQFQDGNSSEVLATARFNAAMNTFPRSQTVVAKLFAQFDQQNQPLVAATNWNNEFRRDAVSQFDWSRVWVLKHIGYLQSWRGKCGNRHITHAE
jgi:hypothetical protein